MLSPTGLDSDTATGQLLATLFHRWPATSLLQVCNGHPPAPGLQYMDAQQLAASEIHRRVASFQPELIYLRPTDDDPSYTRLCTTIIERSQRPLVTHIMDDWPARAEITPQGAWLRENLRRNIDRAACNLTICDEMSAAYEAVYDRNFTAIHNGIDPDLWQDLPSPPAEPFLLRYSGALAQDMQLQSVSDVASAVARLADDGVDLRLEIYTHPWFLELAEAIGNGHQAIACHPLVPKAAYPALLSSAHAVLVCYNFDDLSRNYTRYSFANKTFECLASGAPVLAYGPQETPSIAYIQRHALGYCVLERDAQSLENALRSLTSTSDRQQIARRARTHALTQANVHDVRNRFEAMLIQAATHGPSGYPRSAAVAVDECAIVYDFLTSRRSIGTMVDVGAHHGAAFARFLGDGWTVHAFEPDPDAFAALSRQYDSRARLILNNLAVTEEDDQQLPMYAAAQSSGISSLVPFHDQHEQRATVRTTRLDSYLAAIEAVQFLKVDTEGYDLMVLRSFPWQRLQPDVVVAEFEDRKTATLGHDHRDIADFLAALDYQVFVSEWHPVERYGVQHQWHRLAAWPCQLRNERAWGNMIAFRQHQEPQAVAAMFDAHITAHNPHVLQRTNPSTADETRFMPSRTHIANHFRIFRNFLRTRRGVISALLVAAAYLAPTVMSALAKATGVMLLSHAGFLVSAICAYHLVAYLLESLRLENVPLENACAHNSTLLQQLRSQITAQSAHEERFTQLQLHQATLEKDLHRLQQQQLEVKQRLPEVLQQIIRLRRELDADS